MVVRDSHRPLRVGSERFFVRRRIVDELRRLVKEVSVGVISPGGGMSIGSMMEPSPEEDNEPSPQKQELENIKVILKNILDALDNPSQEVNIEEGKREEIRKFVYKLIEKVERGEGLTPDEVTRIQEIQNRLSGRILEVGDEELKRRRRMYDERTGVFGGWESGVFVNPVGGGSSVSSLPLGGGLDEFSPKVVGVFRKSLRKKLVELLQKGLEK